MIERFPPQPPPRDATESPQYLDFLARLKSEEALRHAPLTIARELGKIRALLERVVDDLERRR